MLKIGKIFDRLPDGFFMDALGAYGSLIKKGANNPPAKKMIANAHLAAGWTTGVLIRTSRQTRAGRSSAYRGSS